MVKKIFWLVIILFVLGLGWWLLNVVTFNPVTDRHFILHLKSIIAKVENYEAKHPIPDEDLWRYYQFIEVSEEELLLVEYRGVTFRRELGNYMVIIPVGFDRRLIYKPVEDCWYGDKLIIGLKVCQ